MDGETSDLSSSRGTKRKTRGPTLCKKLKEKIADQQLECIIDFNQYGDPIGEMRKKFNSYIGTVVRLHVNINIESWDVVNEGLKDMLWDDIRTHWKLKDDMPKRKKKIMEKAAKLWRTFKTNLVKFYVRKGLNACEKYNYISNEDWEMFTKTRQTDEFKEISDKAKANQKQNLHPHYLGKGGYEDKKGKWHANDPLAALSEASSVDPSIILNDQNGRCLDWVRARTKKTDEGLGFFIPNEHTKEVFNKMAELQGKVNDGSWTPHGHDDLLSRALGKKEHGGRVRGVGGSAKIKEVFGSENYKQSGVVSVDDLEAVTKRVRQECQHMMNVKLQGIYDYLKQMGLPLPAESFGLDDMNTQEKELIRSSCNSVDRPDTFPNIEIPTLCRLYVIHHDKGKVIVARGQVFPSSGQGGGFVHGKSVAPNNVKVCIDSVEVDFQQTRLPVPSDEHETVGSAEGSFVQWPKNLVTLGQDAEKVKDNKVTTQVVPQKINKIISTGSVTPLRKKDAFYGNDANLSEKCRTLKLVVNNLPRGSTTKVDKDGEVFKCHKSNAVPIYVARDDVDDFLRMGWLNIPILQIFMLYIHKLCKDLNHNSFAFMCPSVLALASINKHQLSISRYLSRVMKEAKEEEKRFILAPYIQEKHWVLFIYSVEESAVYVFDSLKHKRDLHVKIPMQAAYKIYVASGGRKNKQNNLLWFERDVQCPQQEGGTECGFYVMRYMYDIVMLSRKDPKTSWKQVLGTESYTEQQLDEIRDLWADFFCVEYL